MHGGDASVGPRWINKVTLFFGPVENIVQDLLTRRRLSTGLCLGDAKGLSRAYGGRVLQGLMTAPCPPPIQRMWRRPGRSIRPQSGQ